MGLTTVQRDCAACDVFHIVLLVHTFSVLYVMFYWNFRGFLWIVKIFLLLLPKIAQLEQLLGTWGPNISHSPQGTQFYITKMLQLLSIHMCI